MPDTDRFGNRFHPELPYARGKILSSTEADYREIEVAREHLRRRIDSHGREGVFNFTGLERGFPAEEGSMAGLDDELAPALHDDAFTTLALDHLGGSANRHDVFLANRLTAATASTLRALVEPGDTVVGVAPNRSHPSVVRSAGLVDASFVDTTTVAEFEAALDDEAPVSLAILSRMDVTYERFDPEKVDRIISSAHAAGARVYIDDAGAARVLPAVFDDPRSLETGADVVATGLDKYGVFGPRFGLLGGDNDLVSRIRSHAWKLGLEARPVLIVPARQSLERYEPGKVREQVATAKEIGAAIDDTLDGVIRETEVIGRLEAADILELAMDRAGLGDPPIVPFEATAALSMLMLKDHGVVTVHFAGIPSGTADFLVKFVPPETLERFGGAAAFASAVDAAVDTLADSLSDPATIRELLLGG